MTFYDYVCQIDTSVYAKLFDNGEASSEGNCVLNATYSMLHNMGKFCRDREFYHSDYYVDYTGDNLTHDAHYSLRNNVDGWKRNNLKIKGTPNQGKYTLEYMSDLYLRIRERGISSYGYDEENGMSGSDIKNMAMDIDG